MKALNTYGYTADMVKDHLSDEAKKTFEQYEGKTDKEAVAYVQACYKLLMQMLSVASGDRHMVISDAAIKETADLLLAE